MTEEQRAYIASMSHEDLCRHWRFAPIGDPLMSGDAGDYVYQRLFKEFGGFTPEISRRLGWDA